MSLVTNNDSSLSAKSTQKIMALLNHIVAYESPFLQMASCSCKHLFHLFSIGCLQEFIFWGGKVLFERPLIYNSTPTSDFVIPALVSILKY